MLAFDTQLTASEVLRAFHHEWPDYPDPPRLATRPLGPLTRERHKITCVSIGSETR